MRETDRLLREKKQLREFLTDVKGILCTRFIYLRLKTTDFWATYGEMFTNAVCLVTRPGTTFSKSETSLLKSARLIAVAFGTAHPGIKLEYIK